MVTNWTPWGIDFWLESHFNTTIICDRYGGIWSGGKWLAFPEESAPDGPLNSDGYGEDSVEEFWDTYAGPVGKGASPGAALADLEKKMRALL